MEKGKTVLEAKLFGQLQIAYDGIVLTEEGIRSDMVSKLLGYILLHNKRSLSVRELTDMLWSRQCKGRRQIPCSFSWCICVYDS